jgi:hypothetical protein
MGDVYTHSVLERGRVLAREDGHCLVCDRMRHYRFSPDGVQDLGICTCDYHCVTGQPARPRYEIYNRDADFFWDHKKGALFWLKLSSGVKDDYSLADTAYLVEKIVDLLNRDELREALYATDRETKLPKWTQKLTDAKAGTLTTRNVICLQNLSWKCRRPLQPAV